MSRSSLQIECRTQLEVFKYRLTVHEKVLFFLQVDESDIYLEVIWIILAKANGYLLSIHNLTADIYYWKVSKQLVMFNVETMQTTKTIITHSFKTSFVPNLICLLSQLQHILLYKTRVMCLPLFVKRNLNEIIFPPTFFEHGTFMLFYHYLYAT